MKKILSAEASMRGILHEVVLVGSKIIQGFVIHCGVESVANMSGSLHEESVYALARRLGGAQGGLSDRFRFLLSGSLVPLFLLFLVCQRGKATGSLANLRVFEGLG